AGLAAFMKAVNPSLSNGVIVGRVARNADPAGTEDQTGNGRINMPRALADASTEEVQPAGAAPLGNGGPFVGRYRAANKNFGITFAGTGGGSVTFSGVSPTPPNPSPNPCTSNCSVALDNDAIGTLSVTPAPGSAFVGWSGIFSSPGTT